MVHGSQAPLRLCRLVLGGSWGQAGAWRMGWGAGRRGSPHDTLRASHHFQFTLAPELADE